MARTRFDDIRREAVFGQRLFRLGEKHGLLGPAAIGQAIYDNIECFRLFRPGGRDYRYAINMDKDLPTIRRRVDDHLDVENAYDLSGNYMYAYSILFNCSLDFLYGRIDEECPNLEVLDISKKTGLSIKVVQRIYELSKDGENPMVDCWSSIMESPLFDSVYKDWGFITLSAYDKIDLEARLAALVWEKKHLAEKGIDPLDNVIFENPRDLDYEITAVQEGIANKDAAFYGMLSKVSKNFADFLESNAKAHYSASRGKTITQRLQFVQRAYEDAGI